MLRTRTGRSSRTVVLALACCFTLTVAACGSGSSTAGGPSGASGASASGASGSTSSDGDTSASNSATGSSSVLGAGSTLADICKAGEAEGKLIVRKSTDPEVFDKEVEGFEKKYPGIKIDYGVQNPENSINAVVTHKQTGQPLDVDMIDEDISDVQPLLDLGYVRKVDWKALGVDSGKIFDVEKIGLVRTQRIVLGLAYNTKKLKASDIPDTWQDLINNKWSGKIIVDPRGKYLAGLAITWGKDKAVSWYKEFMETDKPMVVQGATASVQRVISGEALLSTSSHDAEVNEQAATGAPIDIKYLDVIPTADHYAVVLDGAPHPNAAACFISWFASADGGEAAQLKYEFKNNETKPKGIAAGAVLAVPTNADDAEVKNATAEEFAKLTSG